MKLLKITYRKKLLIFLLSGFCLACTDFDEVGYKFLEDVNLEDGTYALYVKDKTRGEFMVTDIKSLQKNKNKLKIDGTWLSDLLGAGDDNYGVTLFKNNKIFKNKTGSSFYIHKIGNLKDSAIPVKTNRFNGNKKEAKEKLSLLASKDDYYILHKPFFSERNQEFRFRIMYPV
ncbi:hypothetical protein MHTCC0001_32020 [Flavobacteriaceae bacterium MHTCC 0001]